MNVQKANEKSFFGKNITFKNFDIQSYDDIQESRPI